MAAFSRGQPGGSGRPSRHKGAEAVCMSVRYPLAGAWRELQLRTSAVGWRGGMPGVYSRDYASLTHPNAYLSAGFISAELDFLDSVPSWGPAKHRTPAQNVCYPLPWRGCMSSRLDFCGVGRVSCPERAGCVGTYSKKPGLANVLSWASQPRPVLADPRKPEYSFGQF